MKISKPLTKTQTEMSSHIINMLKERAERNKVDDVFFSPKEFVSYCSTFDIGSHKARHYIKILHLDGHLNREKVHNRAYKYTPNGDSKAIGEVIDSIINEVKHTPKIEKVCKPSPEIKQAPQCLKISYGEKKIMNTVKDLQEELSELKGTLHRIECFFREVMPSIQQHSTAQLTLQNLFKKNSKASTQRIKG